MTELTEKYQQISDGMQAINSVVTRIDERVEIFIDKLNSLEKKLEHHVDTCPVKCAFTDVVGRVSVLESKNGHVFRQELKEDWKAMREEISEVRDDVNLMKLATRDIHNMSTESAHKWQQAGTVALNILGPLIYIFIGAILLRFLHLQAPSLP